MSLRFTVLDKGINDLLAKLAAASKDMRPVYDRIGNKMESNVHIRFDTKTDPDGKQWAEWSPEHAAKREKEGRGTLLEYTGRMRDSLTHVADSSGVEVGFGVDYAQWHEPYRHMLLSESGDLSAEDAEDITAEFMAAFQDQLKPGSPAQ